MKYQVHKDKIEIFGKEEFVPAHILECGQIFSYKKNEKEGLDTWIVFSRDKSAEIVETENGFIIKTKHPKYFENFFDLQTDYSKIKKHLSQFGILQKPIAFGGGIRILKQDLFETLISFIISANNNIKRIQLILNRLREKYGKGEGDFYSFPTRDELLLATVKDFEQLGAGYRAKYLFNVLRQVDEKTLQEWNCLPTKELRKKLVSLFGVGPKVADCILLFGYGKQDVFPVDTWIEQMYHKFYGNEIQNREKIREILTKQFGEYSGYAQQYLFYYMRSEK